jgi:electron transfer flavoprotein alpha subunit
VSGILVVADHFNGLLRDVTLELVTAATGLAKDISGPVALAVITDSSTALVDQADLAGVDQLWHCDVGTPHFDPALYEEVVARIGSELQPRAVLFAHSANGMACAAAIAARLGSGFASDVFALGTEDCEIIATRGAYGNKFNVELGFPNKGVVVLTIRGATFKPALSGGAAKRRTASFGPSAVRPSTKHVEYTQPPATGLDLSKADFVLSIGRGVQEEKNIQRFRELADLIGATFACSRPIVDAGWLPKAHQIGQSGKVATNCKLYLALGISGAVQHLYGMKHVETIVAVNTDENAPIYGVARYGAAFDIFEFADALEREFN